MGDDYDPALDAYRSWEVGIAALREQYLSAKGDCQMTTSPEIIAAARPYREACMPNECTGVEGCWVETGPNGCTGIGDNISCKAARCIPCGGKIRSPRIKEGAMANYIILP
jgi:hypothetical protein